MSEIVQASIGLMSGGLTLVVAALVLASGPGRRCNQLFAMVLILRGSISVANRIRDLTGDGPIHGALDAVTEWIVIVFPFAMAAFMVVYLRPRTDARIPLAIVASGVALALVPILAPCTARCATTTGPLALFGSSIPVAPALAGLALLFALRTSIEPRSQTDWLLANAFVTLAVVDGLLPFSLVYALDLDLAAMYASHWTLGTEFVINLVAAGIATLVAAGLVVVALRRDLFAGRHWTPAVLWGLAMVCSTLPLLSPATIDPVDFGLALAGLMRLALPALAAYGLIRYRHFTPTRAFRLGINRTILAGMFVAVYFMASEGTAAFIGDRYGNEFAGILVASLLVFAIVPVERAVRRFTEGLAPSTPAAAQPVKDRRRFYEEQMAIVWLDGQMGVKERLMMDRLRAQLGLAADDAEAIETAAAQAYLGRGKTA